MNYADNILLESRDSISSINPLQSTDSLKLTDNNMSKEDTRSSNKPGYVNLLGKTPPKSQYFRLEAPDEDEHVGSRMINIQEVEVGQGGGVALTPPKTGSGLAELDTSLHGIPRDIEALTSPTPLVLARGDSPTNSIGQSPQIPLNTIDEGNPELGIYNLPFLRQEARLFLIRSCNLFGFSILTSLYLLISVNYNELLPMDGIVFLFSAAIIYFGAENILRMVAKDRENWRIVEDYFSVLDLFCADGFIVCVLLKFENIEAIFCLTAGLFLISIILYLKFSKADRYTKVIASMYRIYYAFQTCVIALRSTDTFLDWEWKFTLLPTWIYIGVTVPFMVAFGLIFLLMVGFAIFKLPMYNTLKLSIQLYGLFWNFVYYGSTVPVFFALNNIANMKDFAEFEFVSLNEALIANCVVNIFLLLFTFFKYMPLRDFMQVFNAPNDLDDHEESNSPRRRPEIQLEVEKKESYLVMISPTYFSPMNMKFAARNADKVKKLKRMLLSFRFPNAKVDQGRDRQTTNYDQSIDINVLKGYKQDLDAKLSHMPAQVKPTAVKKAPRIAKTKTHIIKIANKGKIDEINSKKAQEDFPSSKHLSDGDMGRYDDFEEVTKKILPDSEEKLCYICYERQSDAVLMTCGHGGVCYECAGALVKKSGQCMECRGDVTHIIKVDPNPKLTDIVKGLEISKVNKIKNEKKKNNN